MYPAPCKVHHSDLVHMRQENTGNSLSWNEGLHPTSVQNAVCVMENREESCDIVSKAPGISSGCMICCM